MANGGTTPASPAAERSAEHRSWRPTARPDGPRHRWQQQENQVGRGLLAGRARRRTRIALFFAAAGALLALLVGYLLYAPVQTPTIAIAATAYEWPLAPNAWAAEDLLGLQDLDRKTIRIADLSSDWRSAERGLARLDEALKQVAQAHGRSQVCILLISMHGAIDGQNRPCLIPPGAVPNDSTTWLPLATLLDRIKQANLPAGMHKLLVLDTTRDPVNWSLGQIAGGFVESLPQAIEEAQIPNLAVLTSTSAGQSAAAPAALRGSLFGHYLRLGLAGAADDRQPGGNANGRVSLQELNAYLAAHADAWSAHHRGLPQTPTVFPANADFNLAWALRPRLWQSMVARAVRTELPDPSVAAATRATLWRKLDELRAARPWRYDPLAWRDLEHRLLWLERLASAGVAYRERATAIAAELTSELNEITERHAAARQGRSLPAYAGLLRPASQLPPGKVHSLPLAEFWGTADRDSLRSLAAQLDRCRANPTRDQCAAALALFESAPVGASFDEANLLEIWQRLFVPSAWQSDAPLSQVLEMRHATEQRAVPPADGSVNGGQLPGDERAHVWLRPGLSSLDRARRQAEDAVLAGPRREGDQPAMSLAAQSPQDQSLGERAAKAFALRDRLWAELPWLAQWLCRPAHDAQHQEKADAAIRATLVPLLTAALDLERQLERPGAADGDLPWTADSAVAAVEAKFGEMQSLLAAAISAAATPGESSAAAADLDALLSLPLIAWDVREELTRQRLELHLKLAARYDGPFDGASAVASPAAAAMPEAARAARWPAHPLLLLVDDWAAPQTPTNGGAATDEPLRAAAKLGQRARARLAALSASERTPPPAGRPPSGSTNLDRSAELTSLSAAESRIRRAAALSFPRPGVDPVAELRRADLQAFYLWRAERALDDFQGPGRRGREPQFAVSAADYLALARSLGPLSESAAAKASDLDGLLARRRIAAREALAVSATDILLADQAATVTADVAVLARTPEAMNDLPPTTAAIMLTDQAGRIGNLNWRLELPQPDARAQQQIFSQQTLLETAELKSRGPAVEAVVSIRGNDYAIPLLLRAPGGALVDSQRPDYGPPSVTVLGHERRRASVVFILDCSHSMQDSASAEGPDAAGRTPSARIDIARRALNMLLADLAQRGSLRVGVRLFGHRVGWSTTEANKLLRQTAYADEIPAALRPYADVEEILPLGRFDSIAAGKVQDKLQTVRAWGESPIYLALQQAVGDFGADDNSPRSIVLITDGQNYQFNPPREFQPPLADVLASAQRARVAINIVGFEMPEAEAHAAAREFTEIASRTGGSYVPAASATTLLDSLERLLRPGDFRISSASGAVLGQAELGQRVTLPASPARQTYQVAFEHLRQPIELAGGESVELTIRRPEPRLDVIPYLKGSPRFEPLVFQDNGGSTTLQAGIHRSLRTADGVQFPISIQPTDGRFVPRPVEMWVEVTPLGLPPETTPGAFIFYDAPFLPATGVPVANLLARNWPAEAAQAEVRVFFKNNPSAATEERPLHEVADRLPDGAPGFSVAGASGVTYQVRTSGGDGEPLVVGLIERHQQAETVGALKVALIPEPRGASHQFDRQNRVVLHTFTYDPRAADRARVLIRFTTRDAVLAHSIRTAQSVLIDVSDRSDLLELTPAIK